MLQTTRGVALPAEDLLTAAAIALGIALLISRAWQRKRPFVWNARLWRTRDRLAKDTWQKVDLVRGPAGAANALCIVDRMDKRDIRLQVIVHKVICDLLDQGGLFHDGPRTCVHDQFCP